MNHDSWVLNHHNSKIDSLLLSNPYKPHLYYTSVKSLSKKPWIMIHQSWFIPPLTLPRTVTLLPRSIPESFRVIGPATREPIGYTVQDSHPPPTPPISLRRLCRLDHWRRDSQSLVWEGAHLGIKRFPSQNWFQPIRFWAHFSISKLIRSGCSNYYKFENSAPLGPKYVIITADITQRKCVPLFQANSMTLAISLSMIVGLIDFSWQNMKKPSSFF